MHTFTITYEIGTGDKGSINQKVEKICLEQSAELPRHLLSSSLADKVVGNEVFRQQLESNRYQVVIKWPTANIGGEITNLLNILYGNISLQPGIRIVEADWEPLVRECLGGPALGISDIRERFATEGRAFAATALKPIGLSADELADLCSQFAKGGIDIIKDDHGLANQTYAPFLERVKACVAAVQRVEEEHGQRSYYFPNITASGETTLEHYKSAAEHGADGVLLCPHITGLATMHALARLDIDLPIMAHPAFSGSLTTVRGRGFSPNFLYGQLWRALGADFVIYPNTGGRFSFTAQECQTINRAARSSDSPFNRAFPVPAGGLKLGNIAQWVETYGDDTVFLMGGGLYQHEGGLEDASHKFRDKLI